MVESKHRTLDVNVHRRILKFLNAARRPEELMVVPPNEVLLLDERVMFADIKLHADEEPHAHDDPKPTRPKLVFERDLAKRILKARDEYSPLYGFRHISQLEAIQGFDRRILDILIRLFSPRYRGRWELLYDAD